MKKLECLGHQGDVCIYRIDAFPKGERIDDRDTKLGALAWGEITGHAHMIEEREKVDMFKLKVEVFNGLTFIEVREKTNLNHGVWKGFSGVEPDQDYHSTIELPPGKYVTGIVEETDWLTRTIRKVVD